WNQLMRAADQRRDAVLQAFTHGKREPTPSEMQAAVRAGREVFEPGFELPENNNQRGGGGAPSITAKGGLTPLLHAARQGHLESARALIDGGADVNLVSPSDGTSPLLMAVVSGQFDMAMLLIERGSDPNVSSTLNGVAPLWAAINAEWQPRTRYPQ